MSLALMDWDKKRHEIAEILAQIKNGERQEPVGIRKTIYISEVKEVGSDDERVLRFAGSVESEDRDGDIIEVAGWELDNYKKNPVFLWAHNYRQPPVGKAVNVWVEDKTLFFDIKFATKEEYEFADTIYRLYKGEYLRAVSVGFIPKEWEARYEGEGRDRRWLGNTFKRQELLELSAVPVPAHQDALMVARSKGILVEEELKLLESGDITKGDGTWRVGGARDLPIDTSDADWDAGAAVKRIRKWASSDGSGEKDKMDWKKYRKAFVVYNADDLEKFESYKMPFADVVDGKLTARKKAIYACAVVLQGGRNRPNLSEEELKKAKSFVAHYYHRMDEEAPWERDSLDGASEKMDPVMVDKERELVWVEVEDGKYRCFSFDFLKHLDTDKASDNSVGQEKVQEKLDSIKDAITQLTERLKSAISRADGSGDKDAGDIDLESIELPKDAKKDAAGRFDELSIEPEKLKELITQTVKEIINTAVGKVS